MARKVVDTVAQFHLKRCGEWPQPVSAAIA